MNKYTLKQIYRKEASADNELRFTGNWFIDAGILGFVNLMEEVYGWDLDTLQQKLKENEKKVYYGYFPFAYFYKWLNDRREKINESLKQELIELIEKTNKNDKKLLEIIWWKYITDLFREIWTKKKLKIMHESKCYDKNGKPKSHYADTKYRELIKSREELINDLITNEKFKGIIQEILGKRKKIIKNSSHNLSIEDLRLLEEKLENFSENKDFCGKIKKIIEKNREMEKYLNKIWSNVKMRKIPEENSVFCRIPVDSSFFKDYLFFNNFSGIFKQLEDLTNLIEGNIKYSKYLSKLDGTISKFLPSDEKFSNISYTMFRTKTLVESIPHLFVYLINFLNAFTFVKNRNIGSVFFYGSELDLTYLVNKKLRAYLNKNDRDNSLTILRMTWQFVIDAIMEAKTVWSLENMYLIRYEKLSQQDLVGVEYIEIPKLQATIIIDDTLRGALNKNVPVRASNGRIEERIWILEKFIKNEILLPYLIRHLYIFLVNRINRTNYAGRGSLIYMSMVDAKIREFKRDNKLFGDNFFNRYREILTEIKEDVRWAFSITRIFRNLFKDQEERNSYANLLLTAIRRDEKYRFINILLKVFTEKIKDNKDINNLINFAFSRILFNDKNWRNYALIFASSLIGGESNGES